MQHNSSDIIGRSQGWDLKLEPENLKAEVLPTCPWRSNHDPFARYNSALSARRIYICQICRTATVVMSLWHEGDCDYEGKGTGGEVKRIEVWRKSSKSAVKWSEVKCSDVRWNRAVGNLNGVKPNERVVKCSWVKFKWEEVKCSKV